ncbi:glycine betaine ABC transporter substrate-binding protein [Microbulbifer sp. GL-2]|uniref:glycine betaine ABC transporter substrate-binding protein n=1 Tax=Microbulbifer sp. GL-2 TaxID=2591606 RepID=UPI0011635D21|nr:glycine betaine ABC transporter substrate-binding protein [Microbulbifer sp. GL-2]BBM03004.1 glycine/betaine ABC transporter substrate-binding protein [Microbulbifer sp. GL-2]
MDNSIRIGHIALSFHEASALEVTKILQLYGHKVSFMSAPHEEAFGLLKKGEIDLLVSAWLPSSHEVYLNPLLDQVEKVSVLYEPYCIWGVPDYVPEESVSSIEDLLREPALDRMERLVQGINPGAGISRFSAQMIQAYGLDKAGYEFRPGTEEDCFDRFETAVSEGRWVVIPLWHPQFLHNRYTIRALKEPKGLLGTQDEATLIVRKEAKQKIGDAAMKALSQLYIGNDKLSALEDDLRKQVKNP